MLLAAVMLSALAVLFLLVAMALAASGRLRRSVRTTAGLAAVFAAVLATGVVLLLLA